MEIDKYEFSFPMKAYKHACELIETKKISIVIITIPSYSAIKIMPKLKKKLPDIKTILDVQDNWVVPVLLNRNSISAYRTGLIEKESISSADRVVFATPSMKSNSENYYNIHRKTGLFPRYSQIIVTELLKTNISEHKNRHIASSLIFS